MTHNTNLEAFLRSAGQEHLLSDFERLSAEERANLTKEITAIDFSIFERAKFFDEKTYESLAPIPIFSAERAEEEKETLFRLLKKLRNNLEHGNL